jgi:hypothetical protein
MPTEPDAHLETPPGLLALARERMRTRHLALRSEQAYLQWLERYVAFHRRHPRELGAPEIEQFLTHLAVQRKVSAATQNQALQALLFIYRHVLEIELPWLDHVTCATHEKKLPVVLSRQEVRALLAQLQGTPWLVASLLYGSGLRLMEAMRLRVKDLAIERGELIVREGKGGKDRVTMLPAALENSVRISSGCAAGTRRSAAVHALASRCPLRSRASIPRPARAGVGSISFRPPGSAAIPTPGVRCDTISMRRSSSAPCRARCARRSSGSRRAVIRCGTASPRICWKMATTSVPCRSCSGTRI